MEYHFSRDYEKLFNLIVRGFIAVGFIDYNFPNSMKVKSRDICRIKITHEDNIDFGVRGIGYGSSDFDIHNFITECEKLNLDWISV